MSYRRILMLSFAFLCTWMTSIAQTKQLKGRVTSLPDGQPLKGVTVTNAQTNNSTTTDDDGRFSIDAAAGNRLSYSHVGYSTGETVVTGSDENINIQLQQSGANLDAVVVIGYGTQRKGDVTGAISTINSKALKDVPVTNVSQMLQGRAAGVYVTNAGNKPGAGMTVQIRGRRSFNAGNDPLYVIDGIPISGGFNDINPNDIESINILKDASATAIYGSRGANGVILVTTKRGRSGRPTVSYDAYYGVSKIMRYANLMNGSEFAEYKRESRRAVTNPATGLPLYDDADPLADSKLFEQVELESIELGRSTDWQKLMIRNGNTQNHDVSVSGGSESTKFNVSLGYFRDIGIIPGQDFTRYTSRINLDQNIGQHVRIGMSTLGSYSQRNGEDVNPYGAHPDFGALSENPLGIPYDINGELIFLPTSDGLRSNPLSELVPGAVINRGKRFRLLSSIYGEAEIINGLKFRMNFGPDLIQNRKGNFNGRMTNARRMGDPSASESEDFAFSYTWENVLTFKKNLGNKHGIDFTGLYSLQSQQFEQSSINVTGLPVESLEYYNLGAASTINGVSSGYEKWSILSYMARINYSYDNRFLLTLTGRADGSSKFGTGKKWGYFPSVAVAWNAKNEAFLQNTDLISDLKLRISYGETGNEGIAPYQTNGLVSRTFYDFDGTGAFGFRPSSIRNNDLRWETTASFNAGFDFRLFNNRLFGSFELYRSKTTDLLLPRVLPATSGFSQILSNVGSKRNSGFELSLGGTIIVPKRTDGFEWSADANVFTNKEEIIELSQGKVDDVGNLRFIGHPAVVYFDYVKLGIWQLGEEAQASQYNSIVGGIKVADLNKNGVIDPGDRQILGSDVPKLIGGLTNRFSYKNFDLSIVAFGRSGNMIRSPTHEMNRFLSGRVNQVRVNYWTKNNPTNDYPQPNSSLERPLFGSTLAYFDGSFVKVRNISLGYTFPSAAIERLKLQLLRLYVSAQNPFVFSPYTSKHNGVDPEFPTLNTPAYRTFLVGLNVKL